MAKNTKAERVDEVRRTVDSLRGVMNPTMNERRLRYVLVVQCPETGYTSAANNLDAKGVAELLEDTIAAAKARMHG